MLLRHFIQSTIAEIAEGIKLSQNEIDGVIVNPPDPYKSGFVRENDAPPPKELTKVGFDIAIETKTTKEKGFEVNAIQVASFKTGRNNESSTVNRVSFKVPVLLPKSKAKTTPSDS